MNSKNPLESIYYITIPENFIQSENAFKIDTSIKSFKYGKHFICQ